MTHIPFIPETAPFTLEQRAWLNGFLAGLFSNGATSAPQITGKPATPGGPLTILFGSQTGTAEGLAKRIAKDSEKRGFTPRVFVLNDFEQANLLQCGKALIISSTWGDGDPPDNAAGFWSWLKSESAPRLENLQFAVLRLGDKNYPDFCGASKKFDEWLSMLGAQRLLERGECDVDYETSASEWLEKVWTKLRSGTEPTTTPNGREAHEARALGSRTSASAAVSATAPRFRGVPSSPLTVGPATDRVTGSCDLPANGHTNGHKVPAKTHDKTNPFPARLLRNVTLNRPGSSKEVRHFEISLDGSGLNYEVGDALGVVPVNCPDLAEAVLTALKWNGEEIVTLRDFAIPVRRAMLSRFDLTKPSAELLQFVARVAPEAEFTPLLAPGQNAELKEWLRGRDLLDVIRYLPTAPSISELTPLFRKLNPRLYSISSSPKAHPGEVHLTVSVVRYECFGRSRKGVASTFLADRVSTTDRVSVFVQPSHGFKLPRKGDTPIIMVGPGTGIAPFRAFLEERRLSGAKGKNWLFFGDQKRETDFLYEEELTRWKEDGSLSRLDLAFSRDQSEKVYVQHRMSESGRELWSWLESGAHFYVCGDASRMAKDVDATLHQIIEKHGVKTPEEAMAYVARLKSEKRYQRDIY